MLSVGSTATPTSTAGIWPSLLSSVLAVVVGPSHRTPRGRRCVGHRRPGVIPELVDLSGDASEVVSIADFTAPEHGAQDSMLSGDTAASLASPGQLAFMSNGSWSCRVERTLTLDQAGAAHAASA